MDKFSNLVANLKYSWNFFYKLFDVGQMLREIHYYTETATFLKTSLQLKIRRYQFPIQTLSFQSLTGISNTELLC